MKHFAVTAFCTALVFSVLGEWLVEDLVTTAFETAMNSGSDKALDDLAIVLLDILITPFVFVLECSPPASTLFFTLNGICWAGLFWVTGRLLHRVWRRVRQQDVRH